MPLSVLQTPLCPLGQSRISLFDPQTIPNLVTWLRPESLPLMGCGDPVSLWLNEASLGNDAVVDGDVKNCPVYETESINRLYLGVGFKEAKHALRAPIVQPYSMDFTIFGIFQLDGAYSGDMTLFAMDGDNLGTGITVNDSADRPSFHVNGYTCEEAESASNLFPFGTAVLIAFRISTTEAPYSAEIYRNGSLHTTINIPVIGYESLIHLGCRFTEVNPALVILGELAFYNRFLASDEVTRVSDYLIQKYAIS